MPRAALYAGSFDPVTNGHVDVVRQAARLADRLILAIGLHPGKAPLFSVEERLAMLEESCGPVTKAAHCELKTITFADLVVAAARREGATLLIRGLRDGTDLDYEMQIDRKSTRLNSSHVEISYAVFCLKKKKQRSIQENTRKRKRRNFT